MEILVSGSLAYDRIMKFGGRFRDHILADQLDNINISFGVDSLTEHIGGTAGNIAYSLSLLGERPRIVATMGRDYHRYFEWLMACGIGTGDIRVVDDELTAGAYITTDSDNNQITGFNPGAMKQQAGFDFAGVDPANAIAIVGPGNIQDMADFAVRHQEMGIYSIFDPGQSLPIWEPENLARAIRQSNVLIANDYELEMILNRTGLSRADVANAVEHVIVTKGADGAELTAKGDTIRVPVIPAENLVDPTGAGDAFRGGLIKGILSGESMERAVQMGTVCGHYAVQTQGTQTYAYTLDEYNAKLRQWFGG
jgi:adenosine kinase